MKDSNAISETLMYLYKTMYTSFTPAMFKSIFALHYIVFSFLFDIKMGEGLTALFILVIVDFISGVSAARYNNEPIRSAKIKHTAIKMTAYFSVISASHLAESGVYESLALIDETVLAFFLITELISLLENVGKLGVDTPKGLIKKLVDYKTKL